MSNQKKGIAEIIPTTSTTEKLPLTRLIWVREYDESYTRGTSSFEILKLNPAYRTLRKGNKNMTNRISSVPFVLTPQDYINIELLKCKIGIACKKTSENAWANLLFNMPYPVDPKEKDSALQHKVIHTLINMGQGEVHLKHIEKLARTLANQVHHDFFVDTSSAK